MSRPDITWLLFEDHGVTGLGRARTVDVDGNVVEGPEPWPWQVLVLGMFVGLLSLVASVAIVGGMLYVLSNTS